MGCDGGTIPRRDELVRTKEKPEKKDKDSDRHAKWNNCALTQEVLYKPIVACQLGRLYNKASVIELLLNRSKFESSVNVEHIKTLKDVKELNLTDNSAYSTSADKGDAYVDVNTAKYTCPVTGLEMNGKYRFCLIWSCGCVMSERAIKEVKSDNCHKCGKPVEGDDVILLNPIADDEIALAVQRMEEKKLLLKANKKNKKHKQSSTNGVNDDEATTSKRSRVSPEGKSVQTTVVNGHTAELPSLSINKTASSVPEKASRKADVLPTKSQLGGGIGAATAAAVTHSLGSKANQSIQHDPAASKVLKSLFTTCEEAKRQPKAHWVTHNPMYY